MLYYLFQYLETFDFPGAGLFQYISFRAGMSIILSLIISSIFGKSIIRFLQKKQIGETIRELGLQGQYQKKGTPTMGGIIIIASILIPTFLFTKLDNIYIILMIITTIWLGIIGFIDDYIKVFKKNKKGLSGKFKILGQVTLGIIVAATLYFNKNVVIRHNIEVKDKITKEQLAEIIGNKDINKPIKINVTVGNEKVSKNKVINLDRTLTKEEIIKEVNIDNTNSKMYVHVSIDHSSTFTTIPFLKNNEFDYSSLIAFLGNDFKKYSWIIFTLIVIFIITAVSNGANITDGLDGLATGTSAIVSITLGILAYLSGNIIFSDYLNIMYIPNTGELVVFISALIGSTIGFLWYNSFPAQVFMGDTGSLTLGGIIAVLAIIIRKELLIPLLCGVFLIESISVVLQVSYFKYTKKKYGEGRRIFKMAPLHHHYQKKGYSEPKIVARFWIISILLAVITIITLKLR